MTDVLLSAEGENGQLELTSTVLRIKRGGVIAFLTQGLKGDKEIQISQISSIQFRDANFLINGYIQFAFIGGLEGKGGIFEGALDENTVMFGVSKQGEFEAFRNRVQEMIASRHSPQPAPSALDEIEKLASLHAKGILTDEEFQMKKKQLLGI